MEKYYGKSVLQGIAVGKLYVFEKKQSSWTKQTIEDADAEMVRFSSAKEKAVAQLDGLYRDALEKVGEENAMIFDVHKMMLDDLDYLEAIEERIRSEMVNAEYAVTVTGEEFSAVFASMDDDYMKARAADVIDISARVVRILEGGEDAGLHTTEPVIVLADDLSPSETIQMDKTKILAFVTKHGSANSHTAILARSLNIPSLVNVDMEILKEYHGKEAVVDGVEGALYVEPDEQTLAEKKRGQEKLFAEAEKLQQLIGKENITKDGRSIKLYANMGNVEDVEKVLKNDAGGIGLFRSEFLYLGRDTFPTEEEQFLAYKEVVSRMEGKKVIIRTLDIGADKKADYFGLDAEENPALGYRAIRICLTQPEIFKTQLRAIYRAAAFGTVSIMFPMIISVSEIRRIKEIVAEVKAELTQEGVSFGEAELGIMIETPAAAIVSGELAKEVEFFSIGTNDLTQYTLAIDRQNQKLEPFYDSHHPAVLRLIQMTIENGHKAGIWVGICGELAADDTLTETFLDMGLDELSVSPTYILKLRDRIRNIG
ncbi:MAG: phosphoenolpyruvate--protein phosphotransferase [Lachnospiraceae bacterium]|nr:phosphoenolpyruvate--protein phosphotransferase [Lachnospiraceae bacterium]